MLGSHIDSLAWLKRQIFDEAIILLLVINFIQTKMRLFSRLPAPLSHLNDHRERHFSMIGQFIHVSSTKLDDHHAWIEPSMDRLSPTGS